jgi:large subunit ribosomal protein L23
MRIHDVIIRPLITEKAMAQGKNNVYVFEVSTDASKHQVKEAIEKLFNVEVKTITTLVRKGKERRVGRRMKAKALPDVKKAYITVSKGSIDIVPKV